MEGGTREDVEEVEKVKVLLMRTIVPMLKRGTVTETEKETEKEIWL